LGKSFDEGIIHLFFTGLFTIEQKLVEILVPKKSFIVYFFNLREAVRVTLSPPEGEAAQGAYPLAPLSSPSFYLLTFLDNLPSPS